MREDLEVASETVRLWLKTLEHVYYFYSLSPWTKKIARSLTKERKLYFWDCAEVQDPGARFENMVVSHALKAVDYWNESGLGKFGLFYIRDKQKRETDLVITDKNRPTLAIEVKRTDRKVSESLIAHASQLGLPHALQVIETAGVHDIHKISSDLEIRVISANALLSLIP